MGDVLGRRRRASVTGGRGIVHKVRVSPEEESALLARCDGDPLQVARLLVESALTDQAGETVSERRRLLVELFAARRELARIGVNVNQLARRANVGDGFPVEEARAYLVESRSVARRIDGAIDAVASLGVAA